MPNGQPAQLANLKPPWRRRNKAPRRSRDVDRALREYRKLTLEAAKFVGKVLRDETEDTRLRLKAAEIIALHGMPKGDAAQRALEGLDGVNSIKVEFVSADGTVVSFEQAELRSSASLPRRRSSRCRSPSTGRTKASPAPPPRATARRHIPHEAPPASAIPSAPGASHDRVSTVRTGGKR